MLDAFGADQPVGQGAHLSGLAANYDDLQAQIMIQVNVQSGKHRTMIVVLDAGQFRTDQTGVMVVDQRNCSYDLTFRRFPGLFDKLLADHVAEGFTAVCVAPPGDQAVKPIEQFGVDRDSDAAKLAHCYTS